MFDLIEFQKRQINNQKLKELAGTGSSLYKHIADSYNETCNHGLVMHFGKTTWDNRMMAMVSVCVVVKNFF